MKTCSKCKKAKPVSEFGKNKRHKDCLQYYCKECNREASLLWNENNPGRRKEYNLKYDEKNRLLRRNYQRQYSKDNPLKALTTFHNSRARREGGFVADLASEQLGSIWSRYDNRCCLTGEENPTVDHIIPISLGGGTTYTTLFPSHQDLTLVNTINA